MPDFVVGWPWAVVVGVLRDWMDRAAQRRALAALDARLLADVGLTRAEAACESAKPVWRA